MLDAAMACEVEDCLLAEDGGIEIARVNQKLVLFGGYDGVNQLADTWSWDGNDWTQVTPVHSPPKRAWAAILIVGVAAVLLALALVLLVPILVEQVRQLVTALPTETERFKAFIERYGREWLGPTFPSFQTALDKALAEQSQNWAATVADFHP